MNPMTQDALLKAFDLIDRASVTLPEALPVVDWDELDYFAWRDTGNPLKVYMCLPLPERTIGLVFRVTANKSAGACDLCLTADRTNGATLATTESWSEPRTRVGVHICTDFSCSAAVRSATLVGRMGETLPVGQRVERLQRQLHSFARRVTNARKSP